MNTISFQAADDIFRSTAVDNIFITEYMPFADGDFVKIYLFGLKNTQNPESKPLPNHELARILDIEEEKIMEAYNYWANKGIVEIHDDLIGGQVIVFLNVSEVASKNLSIRTKADNLPTRYLKDEHFLQLITKTETMLGGVILPPEFIRSMITWKEDFQFDYECICYLLEYSLTIMNQDQFYTINGKLNYLNKVANNWYSHNIHTIEDAIFFTEEHKTNNQILYSILNELGIHRSPIRLEKEMVQKWVRDYKYDYSIIMEGIRRTSVPNFNYLDKILTSWHHNNYRTVEDVRKAAQSKAGYPSYVRNNKNNVEPTANEELLKAAQSIEENFYESIRNNRLANEF